MRMYWIFYRSLLPINIAFSLGLAGITTTYMFLAAPIDSSFPFINTLLRLAIIYYITGGLIISIGYHEYYKKKMYSFYYNHALTKVKLFVSALLINSVIGTIILTIYSLCIAHLKLIA